MSESLCAEIASDGFNYTESSDFGEIPPSSQQILTSSALVYVISVSQFKRALTEADISDKHSYRENGNQQQPGIKSS